MSLVFINTNNPDDAKSAAKRRAVRAHAARSQHENAARGRVVASAKLNRSENKKRHRTTLFTFPLDIGGLKPGQKRPPWEQSSDDSGSQSLESATPEVLPPNATPLRDAESTPEEQILPQSDDADEELDSSASSQDSLIVLPRMPGAGWVKPFVPYPGQERAFVPAIIDHYLSCMAVDIPELDEAGKPGLLRSRWFPMVITEAATLHVVLLTAASHYASSRNIPQISSILFKMKGEAIRSINAGLRNTTEEITDQLIGAVAKMASYEAMFGDPNLFHLHMRAVYRMVKIRGGLETLGLNGLLGRMVLWIDINSSFLLNSTLYFAPLVTLAGHVPPKPNPAHFLGES